MKAKSESSLDAFSQGAHG